MGDATRKPGGHRFPATRSLCSLPIQIPLWCWPRRDKPPAAGQLIRWLHQATFHTGHPEVDEGRRIFKFVHQIDLSLTEKISYPQHIFYSPLHSLKFIKFLGV